MLNKWLGMGRLTRDPELRTTQSGKSVTTFTIAVDRDYEKDKADFVTCVAWKNTAEFVHTHFRKGQLISVIGELQSRTWNDSDGNKHTSWEVQVQNVYFCEKKRNDFDGLD